jgi:transcription antitermination factor NusG
MALRTETIATPFFGDPCMPILPLETFLFPEELLSQPYPPSGDAEWWVLHTKPRAEKKLARTFLGRRLSFFLPLLNKRRWYNNSPKFESHLPMFPSYIFLYGTHDDRQEALMTNQIVQVLNVNDQLNLHSDLARVYQLITAGVPVTPEATLEPGMPVEIVDGPFTGMQGTYLSRANGCRLYIEVRFLHRGVSVEIDPSMIRVLSAAESTACI